MAVERANPLLKRVFFIDDDEATNVIHSKVATNYRLANELSFYTHPTQALTDLSKLGERDFPELILVDVNMPWMDGHEFMAHLRKLPSYNPEKTCVSFVTSSYDMRDVIHADENQVDCYYWKPLNSETLNQIMAEHKMDQINPKYKLTELLKVPSRFN